MKDFKKEFLDVEKTYIIEKAYQSLIGSKVDDCLDEIKVPVINDIPIVLINNSIPTKEEYGTYIVTYRRGSRNRKVWNFYSLEKE